jgi:hypothetical protein
VNVEISPREVTFLRHAIHLAQHYGRLYMDTDQIDTLNKVSGRLWDAWVADAEVRNRAQRTTRP